MFCVTTAPSRPRACSSAKNRWAGLGAAARASASTARCIAQNSSRWAPALKFCSVSRAASKLAHSEAPSPPPVVRKGVMPLSTLIPAPENTTTRFAACTRLATLWAGLSASSTPLGIDTLGKGQVRSTKPRSHSSIQLRAKAVRTTQGKLCLWCLTSPATTLRPEGSRIRSTSGVFDSAAPGGDAFSASLLLITDNSLARN
mmetsp:Transcript_45236/g.78260  ORF Transcript_45236/g.78260 Transcript_45236/m.78260 type:complete len:201 (-) Transcript_45236:358-960(-)